MNDRQKSVIQLNVAVLLWGGTSLFAKWISLPAFQISGMRALVAGVVLLIVVRLQGQKLAAGNWRDAWILIAIGLALAAHWVTFFHAMQVSSIAIGILSLHIYPVLTALVEPILFKEKLKGLDLGLALVVFAGIVVLVPEFNLDSQVTRGVVWGVFSAFFFTARNLLSRHLIRTHPSSRIMFYQFITSGIILLPFLLAAGQPVSGVSWGQILVLGVAFTALPQTLFTNCLRHLTTRTVSVIATILPIYAAVLAAVVLDEIPTSRTVLGGSIILGAVFLDTWRAMRRDA